MWPSIYLIFIFSCQVLAIWPEPQSITSGNSVLWIDPEVHVTYNGASVGWSSLNHVNNTEQVFDVQSPATYAAGTSNGFASQAIIDEAVTRAMETLFTQNIIPWKLVGRDQLPLFEPPKNASNKIYVKTVAIAQTATDNASTFKPLAGQVDESYNLTIGTDGAANITAVSSTGVLHALESFIQLFYQHSEGCIYTNMAPVTIIDAPKFSHRGLNMDVSRNWYPVADILRTIDAISWNKFNRLHIHMTDSQSWPMQIPALPDLADKGAYAAGLSYSPDDIEYIQAYAIKRGVNVIVEFDMPGHTTSIGYGYPDLIAAFDAKPWDTYCAEPPCGTLKLNSSAVDSFLETLFSDVIPRVTPYSAYFHTGGDEVNQMAYLLDDTVNSNLTSVIQPLMQKFVDRNHAQLRAAGLAPVVWEEMLLDWNLTLGDDVLVQTWQSDAAVAAVTGKGHKALAGNYNFWVRTLASLGITCLPS